MHGEIQFVSIDEVISIINRCSINDKETKKPHKCYAKEIFSINESMSQRSYSSVACG